MASSLLALLDDVATVLDDVAAMSKVAAKKTSGLLGDDLALNAQQVSGLRAERELPVIWAVAKGSLLNKAVLVPAALALSALAPRLVTPLLMIGGLFLCREGVEKLAHHLLRTPAQDAEERAALLAAVADPDADLVACEKDKIAAAVRTDFVLSAEIICLTLGFAAAAPFATRAGVLAAVAVLMTVLVYGFVAAVVKLDDLGLRLSSSGATAPAGRLLLWLAPQLLKLLSAAGTLAMFMVGGGILAHGLPGFHERVHAWAAHAGTLGKALPPLAEVALGAAAGAAALLAEKSASRLRRTPTLERPPAGR